MTKRQVAFDKPSTEIKSGGKVVGVTDRVYPVNGGAVVFNDVLVKGDLSGEIEYNGVKLRVVRVHTIIGLEVTPEGARGPIWKGVECQVVR